MFFNDAKKKIAGSIVEHFDSKLPREKSGKMDFKEIEPSKMAYGGEAEDPEHMEELATHSEAMHEAHKSGDHMAHAHALKAFLHAHEAHEAKKKDVDNGPVSDKKDSKHVAIAGDEYD
jgi:hypothetical protein